MEEFDFVAESPPPANGSLVANADTSPEECSGFFHLSLGATRPRLNQASHDPPQDPSHSMRTRQFVSLVALGLVAAQSATAQARTASGSRGGLSWTAASSIVGVNPSATVAGGGDARYIPTDPKYAGVVAIIMDYGPGVGAFICSGTLLPDRRSILTAAHCVTNGPTLARPITTTVYFSPVPIAGDVPITSIGNPAYQRSIVRYNVQAAYTGEVIDQNDIAVLQMDSDAPAFATAFDIYTGNASGQNSTHLGYGARSTIGGNGGANLGTGRLRQGQNRFDFRLDDSYFGGFFTAPDPGLGGERFFGFADPSAVLLTDFDNGLAANNASCRLAAGISGVAPPARFCDLGRGLDEVGVAGGDSGGPAFFGNLIAGVTSFGLSFGPNFGDIDTRLNSSFGEFSGFTNTSIHAAFIRNSLVPEPSTYLMMATGLLILVVMVRHRSGSAR